MPNNPPASEKTLRDEFALSAMHAIYRNLGIPGRAGMSYEAIAKGAYAMADALVVEREKGATV